MSFNLNIKKMSLWFLKRPKTIGTIVFFVMLTIAGIAVKLRYEVIKENEEREMSNTINIVRQNFEEVFKNCYTSALTLAMTINDKGIPENFDKISQQLLNKNESIDAVQLVPNGVIKYVYPFEENKAALNYDILNANSSVSYEAKKSIKSKIMFFAGPFQLKQGGIAVIGRLPVYKNNKFWGFSAVIIKLETLLKQSGIKSIDISKYYFQFSKKNPITNKEEFFLPEKMDIQNKHYQIVSIPDGDWKLYLIHRNKNVIIEQIYTSLFLGIFLALISGLWIYSILKKPAELQQLIEKQTRKILKRETEFRAIFNQAPVGIAKIDTMTGKFITVNDEYGKIVGYSTEELLNTDFQSITHSSDLELDIKMMSDLKNGLVNDFHIEKRYINKSGNIVWVNLFVATLWKKQNIIINHIAIVEDITEKKKAEEELNQSFMLVSEQNKRLLNFSYIVSHNLRSHTSNIQLIADLLENSKSKDEQDEMITLLKKVSQSLDETMRNLNEVVNIRNNINLKIENLNLNNFIENTLSLLKPQIENKSAIVENNASDDIFIEYNRAYLESILHNFISNALRYSHPDRNPIITLSFNKNEKIEY
ncbi:PAS domain S-box protein [Flavobacterium macrobrachii]|uniref:histidine kinase n=1 Tax=Flavobacterium macrobrachii TaxID=591204 RepID=A0ABS2CZU5_9FLAO|nr:PAS domain S-box protein [Flavobacterium macrobrachii]MBM6500497.1 PAS domain S-box protein [Flavobacterium macrobrachii]